MKKRIIIFVVAVLALTGALTGGTLAYFTDMTDTSADTFTVGKVDIELTEGRGAEGGSAREFQMVPGNEIRRDPAVTVLKGSQDCWLFVKFEKTDNLKEFIEYEAAEGWQRLFSEDGVYYRLVTAADEEKTFEVLKDSCFFVRADITEEQMDEIADRKAEVPALTFTAYAVQKAYMDSAETAWSQIGSALEP